MIFNLNGSYKFEHLFDFTIKMASLGFKKSGINRNPAHRVELQNLPTFSGLAGPMYDGPNKIRYETWEVYKAMSEQKGKKDEENRISRRKRGLSFKFKRR